MVDPCASANDCDLSIIEDVVVCSVVKTELFYGAWRSTNREQTLARQQTFLTTFKSLPFDDHSAEIAGQIRAQLAVYTNRLQ